MSERQALNISLVGTNGTGKTTVMVKMLNINPRNLVFPASVFDKAWINFPKITPKCTYKENPHPDRKQRIKVWRLPDLNKFKGTKVIDMSVAQTDEDAEAIFKEAIDEKRGFKNGGLFIDDQKNYIKTKGSVPYHIRKLFIQRRHRMLDIFMASHSFQDVNSDLISWEPKFMIFKTTLPPNDSVRKKIANQLEMEETIKRVNAKAKSNPYYYEPFQAIM